MGHPQSGHGLRAAGHTTPVELLHRANGYEADLADDCLTLVAESELDKLGGFADRVAVRVIERRAGVRVALVQDRLLAGQGALDRDRLDAGILQVGEADVADAV